ncbi:acetyl-CoA acetyltransferase [Verticiella sediminum]|uniref:Acetyl-CoA acetyltransferase n=2 Tax=Verticiella sediminum TaxID=1247510 RepID=A0A556A9J6_9BURK|nr:acetyl-CoA acetyltransferase [Verticiella sediminum]
MPVIVGVGEWRDRPESLVEGLEPIDLMANAARRAEADAGARLLAAVDSVDVVNLVSWRYRDPAGLLAARLGIAPTRAEYGPVGGESPVRYLHEAALRIAAGQSAVALICGAEAQYTADKAARQGIELPWTPFAHDAPAPVRARTFAHPLAVQLGCANPVTVYPFYETASAAHWGQTPAEAQRESGVLWSRYAEAAAHNPYAWLGTRRTPEEILTPSPGNRRIAWPYNKLMVANPMVNLGAALIVTSLAAALRAGVPQERMVHIRGGAHANEPRDYLARDHYWESHAQNAVLQACSGLVDAPFDALELYSCFPCVPKMARRTLGLDDDVQPTVTGGLTFFGAPLNDYMTHAACAMVRRLRERPAEATGLLYGQGEFVTKHHGLVLARRPMPAGGLADVGSVQARADARRGPVPPIETAPEGPARLEAFTILYGADGSVQHGVAMVRTASGARTLAKVLAEDAATLAALTSESRSPVDRDGTLRPGDEGHSVWSAA